MEGVLVTGTARAGLEGECARCLEPISDEIEVRFQELFVYDDREVDPDEELEVSKLRDDLVDLEPLLRDAVVLALPFQPLCEDDCPGLCAECGARLADDPGPHARRAGRPAVGGPGHADRARAGRLKTTVPRTDRRGENSGSPEAEDVAQQHAPPAFAVEGRRADPGDLRQPRVRCQAPAAPRLRHLRPVRRAWRPSPGPLTPGPLNYGPLRSALGDPTLDAELLERALTHRSYAYEHGGLPTNERLEFLGDSVLGVVVTETLYRTHPDLSEGHLAKLRAAVVNARALAGVGRAIKLGDYVKLGRGEDTTGGREKASILSDTVEAVIGAVHLSGGLESSAQVVHLLFDPLIVAASAMGAGLDWKTSLQELSAEHGLGVPEYLIQDEGPDHMKTFTAQVRVGDNRYGNGVGRSKKEAEQAAAETAYGELAVTLGVDADLPLSD